MMTLNEIKREKKNSKCMGR